MILFIASEVMFFVAWFWAFFDASCSRRAIQYARRVHRRALAAEGRGSVRIPGICRCSTR
jgi:heme/copper-type cytochrome/quinol oxidase subunit 3